MAAAKLVIQGHFYTQLFLTDVVTRVTIIAKNMVLIFLRLIENSFQIVVLLAECCFPSLLSFGSDDGFILSKKLKTRIGKTATYMCHLCANVCTFAKMKKYPGKIKAFIATRIPFGRCDNIRRGF